MGESVVEWAVEPEGKVLCSIVIYANVIACRYNTHVGIEEIIVGPRLNSIQHTPYQQLHHSHERTLGRLNCCFT